MFCVDEPSGVKWDLTSPDVKECQRLSVDNSEEKMKAISSTARKEKNRLEREL